MFIDVMFVVDGMFKVQVRSERFFFSFFFLFFTSWLFGREPEDRNLCFLRPSSLSQGHLFSRLGSTAVLFTAPGVVFSETVLSVRGVVKVDLRDLSLDKSPDSPVTHY